MSNNNKKARWWFVGHRGDERVRLTVSNVRTILNLRDKDNVLKLKEITERVSFLESLIEKASYPMIRELIDSTKAFKLKGAFRKSELMRVLRVPLVYKDVYNVIFDKLVESGELWCSRTGGWYRFV